MISKIDVTNPQNAEEILYIQKEAYSIEAEIVDCYDDPILSEDVEDIMWSEEKFYGYYREHQLVGIISYKLEDDIIDVSRLAIHPDHHREGIGTKLLKFAEENEEGADKIVVRSAFGNVPAEELYSDMNYNLYDIMENDEDGEVRIAVYEKILK